MTHVRVAEENPKEDFIEVIAETDLDSGETKQKRFKFSKRQMDNGSYRDVLRSWGLEIHEDYSDAGDKQGDQIEL